MKISYKTRIFQVVLVSAIFVGIFFAYNKLFISRNMEYIKGSYESEMKIHMGMRVNAIKKADGNKTHLLYSDMDLNFDKRVDLNNVVYGETLLTTDSKNYINNFSDIIVEEPGDELTIYPSSLDDYVLDIIYSAPIRVIDSKENNDTFHSLSHVQLQSTINYPVDASVITQIKDGSRVDILVNEVIEGFTYNEEQDKYHLFFTPFSSANYGVAIGSFDMSYLEIEKDDEGEYVVKYNPVKMGITADSGSISYISDIVDNKILVAYSRAVAYSDVNEIHYYVSQYNLETKEQEKRINTFTKEVKKDNEVNAVDTFEIKDNIYIFYDDLTYHKINKHDLSRETYLIANTGKVSDFQFATDGMDIYMLSASEQSFTTFKVTDGVVSDKKVEKRLNFGLGYLDFNVIYDYKIRPIIEE